MDTERLSNAVSLHVREILFNVAERGDGSYAFEDTGTDEGDTAASKLSTVEMILETARRGPDPPPGRPAPRAPGPPPRAPRHPPPPLPHVAPTPPEGHLVAPTART